MYITFNADEGALVSELDPINQVKRSITELADNGLYVGNSEELRKTLEKIDKLSTLKTVARTTLREAVCRFRMASRHQSGSPDVHIVCSNPNGNPSYSTLPQFCTLYEVKELLDERSPRLEEGMKRETVFKRYFEPFAETANKAAIVDHYSASNLKRRKGKSGTSWFLRKLAVAGLPEATLYTGDDQLVSPEELADEFNKGHSNRDAVMRLNLVLVPDSHFRRSGHARHVRFLYRSAVQGIWPSFTLAPDKGLELFSSEKLEGNPSLTIDTDIKAIRKREMDLKNCGLTKQFSFELGGG